MTRRASSRGWRSLRATRIQSEAATVRPPPPRRRPSPARCASRSATWPGALAVVGHGDGRLSRRIEIEANDDLARVRIVGVLDQLEDRQPGAADQLVAKQLQDPGPWPEGLAQAAALGHSGPSGASFMLRRSPDRPRVSRPPAGNECRQAECRQAQGGEHIIRVWAALVGFVRSGGMAGTAADRAEPPRACRPGCAARPGHGAISAGCARARGPDSPKRRWAGGGNRADGHDPSTTNRSPKRTAGSART